MIQLSLLRQLNPLADASYQRSVLASTDYPALPQFEAALVQYGLPTLRAAGVRILQVNVGKLCNQTCRHCHVDAGPDRRESMSWDTAEAVIRFLKDSAIPTLDITGGAPEMNPNFRWLVKEAWKLKRNVIDRCNLTILVAKGYEYLPAFLAEHQVEIIASLPCYSESNCDSQRGDGVFQRSIQALQLLNSLGYGLEGTNLRLSLVYNPLGPSLPPRQADLESKYRLELRERFGIEFTRLYAITNLPISRFLDDLLQNGHYEEYMSRLVQAFNPNTLDNLMCRTMISVDWLGNLFDCDFNQMLGLQIQTPKPATIFDVNFQQLLERNILTSRHCFGCTAGAGSGCQGALGS